MSSSSEVLYVYISEGNQYILMVFYGLKGKSRYSEDILERRYVVR